MQLINGKILLSDLADELEVTHSALLQHLRNTSGLGEGAEKFGGKATNTYLLPVGSVINFLNWAKTKSRKMSKSKIAELEQQLNTVYGR